MNTNSFQIFAMIFLALPLGNTAMALRDFVRKPREAAKPRKEETEDVVTTWTEV
jgi:hypothetical protein